ncbi:TolB-like translocation protein [Motilibacter aurantiacus]|uniref:hypothetical protein n=1 Tax=Motilibacter aurantiacus TaxID=2714955 RepID=UPI001408D0E6|nr:hypothetical protein [Motilibacter aurantiacus]NHC44000.1 hypothetical protein [Motilibacter aurantiacus]
MPARPALAGVAAAAVLAAAVGLAPPTPAEAALQVPADAYLAYVEGGALWAQRLDGSAPRRLLDNVLAGSAVLASRDGTRLGVSNEQGVFVADTGTGRVWTLPGVDVEVAALAPDGRTLYAVENVRSEPPSWDDEDEPEPDSGTILAVDLVTGARSTVLETAPVSGIDVSADGSRLVFTSSTWTGDRATVLTLADRSRQVVGAPGDELQAAFAPDGRVVLAEGGEDVSTADGFDLFPRLRAASLVAAAAEGTYALSTGRPSAATPDDSWDEPDTPTAAARSLWLAPAAGGEAVQVLADVRADLHSPFAARELVVAHGQLPAVFDLAATVEDAELPPQLTLPVGRTAEVPVLVRVASPGRVDVVVQAHRADGWQEVGRGGIVPGEGVRLRITANTLLRAVVGSLVTEPARVLAVPQVRLTVTRRGTRAVLRGTVRGVPGGRVHFRRWTGVEWVRAGSAPVRRDGSFLARRPAPKAASYWLAERPATRTTGPGVSAEAELSAHS